MVLSTEKASKLHQRPGKDLPEISNYPQNALKFLVDIIDSCKDITEHNKAYYYPVTVRLRKQYFTDKRTGLTYLKELSFQELKEKPPFLTTKIEAFFIKGPFLIISTDRLNN
ncbi:hypothetical protein WA026_015346 [Henosepilachna vigintioctopunctata]|uniref:Uncharacterized protein n=1 Tax=Henosepilachna vigintioctopunctata TaxID=420089 RepID=A0AAW1UC39_9CUCU